MAKDLFSGLFLKWYLANTALTVRKTFSFKILQLTCTFRDAAFASSNIFKFRSPERNSIVSLPDISSVVAVSCHRLPGSSPRDVRLHLN